MNLYPFERTAARRGVERGRGHREHRHRRPDDDPRGGQEPRLRRGRRQARVLRRGPRGAARVRRHAVAAARARRSPPRRSPTPRATTPRSRAGSPSASEDFPPLYVRAFEKVVDLPYGENPHQRAAYYQQVGARMHVLSMVKQHHGKQISFNNLLDLDSARAMRARLRGPGVRDRQAQQPVRRGRRRRTRSEAYRAAFACDPLSAYGGVIALNRPVDTALRRGAAPSSSSRCCSRPATTTTRSRSCTQKQNIRILEDQRAPRAAARRARGRARSPAACSSRTATRDRDEREDDGGRHRARARPSRSGPTCCSPGGSARHVKSNAIVLARDLATVGIGAGQMSRVDSVRLAVEKSRGDVATGRRRWRRTRSSRSPTAPSWRSRPASPRSSSPAARCATTRSSPPPTRPGVAMVFTAPRHFRH